ncbi:segregation and condensation protein A [Candidatus Formimonas warabiya]|uniref:Segregation and condensation protein A n=1 Tax=Formimonas warabiya TaxID=1761012 RepID=A0A3G1KNP9_FORW1|nr:segregation/condensation protein A [Candidatus Formimonas warabiya]ATW24089.1 segregation/condensation protein A [Candidatus Formimonas warabiya]
MKYQIKLAVFEGPFDLLLHLIEKNEVDIYDIPIAEITRQYLAYLDEMKNLDLEIASEFLVMAATLLAIKAKMLLPKSPGVPDDPGEGAADPRNELVERLLEYKKFKQLADYLQEREELQGQIYFRPNEEEAFLSAFLDQNPLEGVTLEDLVAALEIVLIKTAQEDVIKEIPREEITIKKKMDDITALLLLSPQGISFFGLFSFPVSRVEIVVQFLALLELIRMQSIKVSQPVNGGDIMIFTG